MDYWTGSGNLGFGDRNFNGFDIKINFRYKMYYTNIKITEANVINHNQHILAVSGGSYALLDQSNLGFAVDAVNHETDPLKQATLFLYYMGVGHTFENGNKRVAFEVAKGILASGSWILNPPITEVIGFVTGSIAQGKATKDDVYDWLSQYSKPTEENPEFNKITKENIERDKTWLRRLD